MICLNCGKDNEEDARFCTFCGAELQGVVSTENKEEAHAASLQTNETPQALSEPAADTVTIPRSFFSKLELAQKICMLAALVIMFVFSFLIGTSINSSLFQQNKNAVYYIFSYFRDTQASLENLLVDTQTYLPYYIHVAFMMFFLAANVVVCAVCLITGIIKFACGFRKKEIRLFHVLLPALISTFGAIVILSVNFTLSYLKPSFNTATIIEIVLISMLLEGIIIAEFILRHKTYLKNIPGFIGFFIGGAMAFLSVVTMIPAYFKLPNAGQQNISALFDFMVNFSDSKIPAEQILFFYCLAAALIFLLFVSFGMKSIASVTKSISRGQQPCKAAVTFYVFTILFAVAELVFACMICVKINALITLTKISLGASPVLSVLFVLIGFAAMITGKILQTKQNKAKND